MCFTEECDCSYPYDEGRDVEPEEGQFDISFLKELIDCEAEAHDGHIQIFAQWWASEGRFMTRPFLTRSL